MQTPQSCFRLVSTFPYNKEIEQLLQISRLANIRLVLFSFFPFLSSSHSDLYRYSARIYNICRMSAASILNDYKWIERDNVVAVSFFVLLNTKFTVRPITIDLISFYSSSKHTHVPTSLLLRNVVPEVTFKYAFAVVLYRTNPHAHLHPFIRYTCDLRVRAAHIHTHTFNCSIPRENI